MDKVIKGFTCECKKYHEFHIWVFAHWDEILIFTCPECEQRYNIHKGIATKE